ncbi:fatty acid synthase [Frankliniella occidentalis]|uniref:Fatty acid synthase n=1 Tax=Frankliniella occidentalis TaxID=133901 RepID=A0A9C6WYA1_FRAOC|nr:fatty acid synthase [Frankliniella occidentalis]
MPPYEAVISGIGGAFPQSDSVEDFFKNLVEGKNLSSVDDQRWKPGLLGTSPHVAKISNVHRFDNNLFKVHKRLAQLMDPLARLMMERSMEAVIDAGLAPQDLENTYTSVYMTTTVSESESRTTSLLHGKKNAGYAIMAGSKTMMSNRISYCLNLNGPSVTLDGDWTVALVALQRAARSIESGESEFALIGAANTCLFPELNKIYENLGVLSADGHCRALSSTGTGCFRSEGAVVFLLQRADLANRVYAKISGVHDLCIGTRSRFLGVDALSLRPVMEDLYRSQGIDVKDVKMLTTDGNAIPEIERDEMESSAAVLCRDRVGLPVSTPKVVVGHGDAVGALVSIIHSIAAMEKGVVSPVTNYVQPADGAKSLRDGRLHVVTEPQPLDLDAKSVMAVNTLGYSGCIAHALFRPNAKVKQPVSQQDKEFPRLVVVSGRTESDAVEAINQIIDKPFDPEFLRLTQQAFYKPINGYTSRAAAIIPSDEPGMRPIVSSKEVDKKDRPVWFVYSGMGSQWAGMGKGLLKVPVFAETIDRLQPILEPEGIDLRETLTTEDNELFENIVYSFISIAATQIGLTNVMRSLGVEPDGMIGHSTGELGCAYGDGCLSEEETLLAAYSRGKASLAVKLVKGMMASIGYGWEEAEKNLPPGVDVACHNSADNSTVSGPTDAINEFVEALKEKNVFARTVNVSNIAFHSRYVKPAGSILLDYLKKTIKNPKKRSSRWVATSIKPGDENDPALEYAGPEFFTNNLLSPVRFEEAMLSVPADAVVIELAPHGLMQPLIRRGLPEGAVSISLTRRGHRDGMRFLLENVGKVFMECVPLKPWVLAPEVSLPVSRGTACLNSLASWDHREEWPLVINTRSQVSRPRYVNLYAETTACIRQSGRRCAAPSTFLEIVWREIADGKPLTSCPVIFENLEFRNPVEMSGTDDTMLVLQLQRETGNFEIVISDYECTAWDVVCVMKGKISVPDPTELVGMASAHSNEKEGVVLDGDAVYSELQDKGLKYDDALKTLRRVAVNETDLTAQCEWQGKWHVLIDSMLQLSLLKHNSGSVFCGKIRKMTIAPQEMRALSSALPLRYLVDRRVIAAPGINIEGYRRAEGKNSSAVTSLALDVHPLKLPTKQEDEDFLQSVALLRVQNSDSAEDISIIVLEAEQEPVAATLQRMIREAVGTHATVRKVLVEPEKDIPAEVRGALLLVTNFRTGQAGRVLAHLATSPSPRVNLASAMVLRCGARGGNDGFIQLASNVSTSGSLSLLVPDRASANHAMHFVHVKTDEAVPSDVQVPVGSEVILVWRGLPREGIFGAVAAARGKPYGAKVRIVIILDEDAPEFSPSKEPYCDRLRLSLIVNILQDGRWCELSLSKLNEIPAIPTRVQGYEALAIGLNPGDLYEAAPPTLGPYDFCGLKDGSRFIGVGTAADSAAVTPDDILRWVVPAAWSDQEAATVPMAYAVAYHILTVLAPVRPGQRVLVVSGISPVSQACIRVAGQMGCTVVATANSEQQRQLVMALNPELPPERVLRHDSNTLKYYVIKAMGGQLVDLALVPDAKLCDSVLPLLALNGSLFTLSKRNVLSHRVGMRVFIDSTNMFGAGPDCLLTTSPRDKKLVQAALQEGITSGSVRPLASRVVDSVTAVDMAAVQGPVKQLLVTKEAGTSARRANGPTNGNRTSGVAFAVAGGRADSLVTLARAAAAKGSTMVLAASRECSSGGVPPRVKFIPALRQTNFVPLPTGQSDAKHFLGLASKAENIKAIVINLEDAADRSLTSLLHAVLPTVNGALRGVRLLVLTESLAQGTETVEVWRRMKLAACAVVGDPRQAAHLLPSLLTMHELPAAVIAFSEGSDARVALGAPIHRPVRADSSDFPRAGAAGRPFLEISSLAPRLRSRHARLEPLPLFNVTGPVLVPRLVRETATRVLSPVLIADGSRQSAEKLAEEILRLQPRGPWAMIGDAENVELVGKTARLVEQRAGYPDWREVMHLAVLESGAKDIFRCPELEGLVGPVHFIKQAEGSERKSVTLNEKKMRHFVSGPNDIAAILNDSLLSPLSKIISC